jgi:ABC-type multidrug transport system ATPase subunit
MVEQDDILHANLTVEESLLFSARYRLPSTMTHVEHLLSVERTIQVAWNPAHSSSHYARVHAGRQ